MHLQHELSPKPLLRPCYNPCEEFLHCEECDTKKYEQPLIPLYTGRLIHATHYETAIQIIKEHQIIPQSIKKDARDTGDCKQLLTEIRKIDKTPLEESVSLLAVKEDEYNPIENKYIFFGVSPASFTKEGPEKPPGFDLDEIDVNWRRYQLTNSYKSVTSENRYGPIAFVVNPKYILKMNEYFIGTNVFENEYSHIHLYSPNHYNVKAPEIESPINGRKMTYSTTTHDRWEHMEVVLDEPVPLRSKFVEISFLPHGRRCLNNCSIEECQYTDGKFDTESSIGGWFVFQILLSILDNQIESPTSVLFLLSKSAQFQATKGVCELLSEYLNPPVDYVRPRHKEVEKVLQKIFTEEELKMDYNSILITLLNRLNQHFGNFFQLSFVPNFGI